MRRRPIRAALLPLLLLAAGCGVDDIPLIGGGAPPDTAGLAPLSPRAPARPSEATPNSAVDGHLSAFVDSIRSSEARRLADGGDRVERPSVTRLVITPTAAAPVVLEDELSGGDLMRLHVYRGRLLDRFAVLEVIFYEGGQFLLVDERTGAQHDIDGVPTGSPDGTRFVTTSIDLVAGHQPNRIAIYGVTEDGITREWSEEPREWGPSHAEWLEAGTVRFRANVIDTNAEPHTLSQTVAWVDRTPTGWQLRR